MLGESYDPECLHCFVLLLTQYISTFSLLFFSRWGVDLLIHVLTLGDFLFWLSVLNAYFLIFKRKGKTFFFSAEV